MEGEELDVEALLDQQGFHDDDNDDDEGNRDAPKARHGISYLGEGDAIVAAAAAGKGLLVGAKGAIAGMAIRSGSVVHGLKGAVSTAYRSHTHRHRHSEGRAVDDIEDDVSVLTDVSHGSRSLAGGSNSASKPTVKDTLSHLAHDTGVVLMRGGQELGNLVKKSVITPKRGSWGSKSFSGTGDDNSEGGRSAGSAGSADKTRWSNPMDEVGSRIGVNKSDEMNLLNSSTASHEASREEQAALKSFNEALAHSTRQELEILQGLEEARLANIILREQCIGFEIQIAKYTFFAQVRAGGPGGSEEWRGRRMDL